MNKKTILIAVIALAAFIVIVQSGIFNALMIFLFVGAIPGTSFTLPPMSMLILLVAAAAVFMHWSFNRQLYPGSPKVKASQHKVLRKTARRNIAKAKTKRRRRAERTYRQASAS